MHSKSCDTSVKRNLIDDCSFERDKSSIEFVNLKNRQAITKKKKGEFLYAFLFYYKLYIRYAESMSVDLRTDLAHIDEKV